MFHEINVNFYNKLNAPGAITIQLISKVTTDSTSEKFIFKKSMYLLKEYDIFNVLFKWIFCYSSWQLVLYIGWRLWRFL